MLYKLHCIFFTKLLLYSALVNGLPACKTFNVSQQLMITDCSSLKISNTNIGLSNRTAILILSFNDINIIHGNEFKDAGLTNIQQLNLSSNHLTKIDEFSFNGLKIIENLDLSNNRLCDLPKRIFQDNPKLQILNLSKNLLSHIHIDFIQNIKILLASNCLLRSLPTTSNGQNYSLLEELYVENNNITDLQEILINKYPILRIIKLSGNRIDLICQTIEIKDILYKLEKIGLDPPLCPTIIPTIIQEKTENINDIKKFERNIVETLSKDYKSLTIELRQNAFLLFLTFIVCTLLLVVQLLYLLAFALLLKIIRSKKDNSNISVRNTINDFDDSEPPPYHSLARNRF